MMKTVRRLESVFDVPASWHLVARIYCVNSSKEHGHVS
jgi:hypothetical protein